MRCPKCASIFALGDAAEIAEEAPARRPLENERLQSGKDYKPSAPRAVPPSRERREREVERKPSGVSVGLLVGVGVVVGGMFLLLVGGGAALWFLFSRSEDGVSVSNSPPMEAMAPADLAPPVPQAARQAAAAPQAVPEAPAADVGEEFVDLPERGEDMPGVAGLKPEQPQGPGGPPGMPGARPRVALLNGRAGRVPGRTGIAFQVEYRFEQGVPAGTLRYSWVILTARGQAYKQRLTAGQLQNQGTLQGRVLGAGWTQGPYQTYLAVEMLVPGRPGLQEEKISEVLTIR